MYDLLIALLSEKISTKETPREQNKLLDEISMLKSFIALEEEDPKKEMTKGDIK